MLVMSVELLDFPLFDGTVSLPLLLVYQYFLEGFLVTQLELLQQLFVLHIVGSHFLEFVSFVLKFVL